MLIAILQQGIGKFVYVLLLAKSIDEAHLSYIIIEVKTNIQIIFIELFTIAWSMYLQRCLSKWERAAISFSLCCIWFFIRITPECLKIQ